MTTTTHRYTAEQLNHAALMQDEKESPGLVAMLRQAAKDATTLQSLRDENARLREVIGRISNWPDGGRFYGQDKIKDFARNALKED